jgi:hypothetical protein
MMFAEQRLELCPRMIYLGTEGLPQWDRFDGRKPDGRQFDVDFDLTPNPRGATLFLRQEHVKDHWSVVLNGTRLAPLERLIQPMTIALAVPPEALRVGKNRLSIVPPKGLDDILVGEMVLENRPIEEALSGGTLDIAVVDRNSAQAIPSRITVTDTSEAWVPFLTKQSPSTVSRTGVVYTGTTRSIHFVCVSRI